MQVSKRVPSLFAKLIGNEQIAIRFENIGGKARFKTMLGRFRYEFILAKCEELDGQAWWVISVTQHNELVEFCRRNGLSLREA